MTEIIWLNNGQGAFDFDYLLNLTSQEFVDDVKRDIEISLSFLAAKIEELSSTVNSYVVSRNAVRIRHYDKETGKISFDMLSCFDIDWISEVMQSAK